MERMTNADCNQLLANAIETGNVSAARAAIITQADSDYFAGTTTALSIADHANELLKAKGIDLFVPDNGYSSLTPNVWDEEAWNMGKAALRLNFSREKVEYVTKLVGLYHSAKAQSGNAAANGGGANCCGGQGGAGTSAPVGCPGTLLVAVAVGAIIGGGVGALIGASVKAAIAGVIIGGATIGAVSGSRMR